MTQNLGDILRRAREAQQLSMSELGRLISANPSQIFRWENGEAVPTPKALAAVADQLELRASELFKLADIPIPSDRATLPAMLRADYDLPPEAIASIEAHIADVARTHRRSSKRSSKKSHNEGRET